MLAVMPRPAVHPASVLSPGWSCTGQPSLTAWALLGGWSCGRGTGPEAREGVSLQDRQGVHCRRVWWSLPGFLGAFLSAPKKEPLCCSVRGGQTAHPGFTDVVTPMRGVSMNYRPCLPAFHGPSPLQPHAFAARLKVQLGDDNFIGAAAFSSCLLVPGGQRRAGRKATSPAGDAMGRAAARHCAVQPLFPQLPNGACSRD